MAKQPHQLTEGQKKMVVMMYEKSPSTYNIAKFHGVKEAVVIAALTEAGVDCR
jgi:hypothetical protein